MLVLHLVQFKHIIYINLDLKERKSIDTYSYLHFAFIVIIKASSVGRKPPIYFIGNELAQQLMELSNKTN